MKEQYEEVQIEIITFEENDIITASDGSGHHNPGEEDDF